MTESTKGKEPKIIWLGVVNSYSTKVIIHTKGKLPDWEEWLT